MSVQSQTLSTFSKMQSGAHKLRWGVRVVGIGASMRGAVRLLGVRLRRPKHSEIQLRSGPVLEFDYPRQFPPILVMFGDLIDPEFDFIRAIAHPDWVVADVGAAIGQFTMFAATLPTAHVYSFEPSSLNIATLRRNIERNGVADRVTVHQLALSNTDGEASFETAELTWMSGLSATNSKGGEMVAVRTLSGEFAILGIDHVAVLKINVAGFEPEVIEGAMPFLAEGRADILILLLGLASLPWYAKVAALGYRFFYYHPTERRLYEITEFDEDAVLGHRPFPARHIIAIHPRAIEAGMLSTIDIAR